MRMLNDERRWPKYLLAEYEPVEEDIDLPSFIRSRGVFIETERPENPMADDTGWPCSICYRPVPEGGQDGVGFTMYFTGESGYAHRDCIRKANENLKFFGGVNGWERKWSSIRERAEQDANRAKAATGKRGYFLELS